jgi:hypothetical protein
VITVCVNLTFRKHRCENAPCLERFDVLVMAFPMPIVAPQGRKHLSMVFAMLMMLAFLVAQTQQLCCALFQTVWAKLGSKRLLWERMRALFYDYALASMRQLLAALLYGLKKSPPSFALDSS